MTPWSRLLEELRRPICPVREEEPPGPVSTPIEWLPEGEDPMELARGGLMMLGAVGVVYVWCLAQGWV